jgi:hypothetical protein
VGSTSGPLASQPTVRDEQFLCIQIQKRRIVAQEALGICPPGQIIKALFLQGLDKDIAYASVCLYVRIGKPLFLACLS